MGGSLLRSAFGRVEIDLLDRQGKDLEELGTVLLVVPLESRAFERQRSIDFDLAHFFVVGDPSSRLRRLFYGGVTTQSLGRGRTFLIDPEGLLRFHVTHSLSERGMAVVRGVVQAHQDQEIAALL